MLMMRDRSDDDALPITHSLLAEMLGVQRPTNHEYGPGVGVGRFD
jgi:hypothetical protein